VQPSFEETQILFWLKKICIEKSLLREWSLKACNKGELVWVPHHPLPNSFRDCSLLLFDQTAQGNLSKIGTIRFKDKMHAFIVGPDINSNTSQKSNLFHCPSKGHFIVLKMLDYTDSRLVIDFLGSKSMLKGLHFRRENGRHNLLVDKAVYLTRRGSSKSQGRFKEDAWELPNTS